MGYFLSMHEGPQSIAIATVPQPHHAMKSGMLMSNEPDLYRLSKWGVHIESLVINRPVENPGETESGKFLYFGIVTLCPIDMHFIDTKLMIDSEIEWLNQYRAKMHRRLEPLIEGMARVWLIERIEPLTR